MFTGSQQKNVYSTKIGYRTTKETGKIKEKI
jgi:hypothetical protein